MNFHFISQVPSKQHESLSVKKNKKAWALGRVQLVDVNNNTPRPPLITANVFHLCR